MIDRGVPIEQVQNILGYTKIETTLIYAQVNQGNVKMSHSKNLRKYIFVFSQELKSNVKRK